MPDIRSGQILAFYLFDVAETVNLQAVPALAGSPATAARLAPKSVTPPYVQYDKPPLSFDGEVVGTPSLDGFRARFRVYDYGVISLGLSRSFSGGWDELIATAQQLIENPDLEARAEALCRALADRLEPALTGYRSDFLSEDYLVLAVSELAGAAGADADVVIAEHGGAIAQALRGERDALSDEEREKILRHRISYLACDVVIPTWNAAFVYDTAAEWQAAIEILEFANSQLLEFRYYDRLLDTQLGSIYSRLQKPRWYEHWVGARYNRAARHVHALFIDVNDLTDRVENTLKFIGDIYAARLFVLVADRLGLERWKANVQEKLKTLDDIYRFAVEQTAMSRGQFLELTVVLILVLELVLLLLGVMK